MFTWGKNEHSRLFPSCLFKPLCLHVCCPTFRIVLWSHKTYSTTLLHYGHSFYSSSTASACRAQWVHPAPSSRGLPPRPFRNPRIYGLGRKETQYTAVRPRDPFNLTQPLSDVLDLHSSLREYTAQVNEERKNRRLVQTYLRQHKMTQASMLTKCCTPLYTELVAHRPRQSSQRTSSKLLSQW